MMGLTVIADIIASVLKIINLIAGRANDPAMVDAQLNILREKVKAQANSLEAILSDPNKSEAEKQKALQGIRLLDS